MQCGLTVLCITIFFSAEFLCAQDIIITTNSEELQVKIENVGDNEIRFKLFGIETGPTLSIQKSDVFMIIYENGTRELMGRSDAIQPTSAAIPSPAQLYTTQSNVIHRNGEVINPDGIELVYVEGRGGVVDFYIGKFEVTQAQWHNIMGNNPSFAKGDNLPVTTVSWNDAQAFIVRLNATTGRNYRLPTEAEWEFAARGGTMSRGYQYSGSNKIGDVAWNNRNNSGSVRPVGTKQPNELGIYDMSGNVWEWCQDSHGSNRMFRGGSYNTHANNNRITAWKSGAPNYRSNNLGFRLVLGVLSETSPQVETEIIPLIVEQAPPTPAVEHQPSAVTQPPIIAQQQPVVTQQQSIAPQSELHYNWFWGTIRQDGKLLNVRQVRDVMSTNSRALNQFDTGRVFGIVSYVGISAMGTGLLWAALSDYNSGAPFLLFVSGFSIYLPASIVGWSFIGNSTKTYNSGLRSSASYPSYQINFGITPNGVGLSMRF